MDARLERFMYFVVHIAVTRVFLTSYLTSGKIIISRLSSSHSLVSIFVNQQN
uniref:Uncharacterized protein n=1 Tax=Arundo donax TaxID=35708 RepID=A0A0A9E7W4_ARUDO